MTSRRSFISILAAVAVVAGFAGCTKDPGTDPGTLSGKVPIVLTQANVQASRGAAVPDGQLGNDSTFNVTTYYYPGGQVPPNMDIVWDGYSIIDGYRVKTNSGWMSDIPYKVVSGAFVPQTSSTLYWPEGAGDKLRFFAYLPTKVCSTAELEPLVRPVSETEPPSETWALFYKLPDDVIDHYDLLVASTDLKGAGDVAMLNFNHTLTRIDFAVRRSDAFRSDDKVQIKDITITNAVQGRELTVDPATDVPFSWSGYTYLFPSFTLASTGDKAVLKENFDLNEEHRSIMRDAAKGGRHYVMAIPMNDAELKSRFEEVTVLGTARINGEDVPFEIPLAGTDAWAPGKKITYLLTVHGDKNVTMNYLVEDWTEVNNVYSDISNAMLEVSQTEVTVNEHVRARVWFKTNQPKVTIEMEAINGSISIDDWDLVADDLSGDNPRNFQYWWDETAGYYVGYVDIETDLNKEYVRSGDGNSGTFYINAGGLRRRIIINWDNVESGSSMDAWDDYPFVGAFWRHNETGERLIYGRRGTRLAPETGMWTAEVIEGDFIVLAKGKTLDDKVWTDMEPGNAENYPVESDETYIEGTGSIFFRIGLTGTINPSETRYGIIRVRSLADFGSPTPPHLIYVRQGEAADYLIDQNYVFSPYNLTSPDGGGEGTGIDLGPRGGGFTQYPTQAGYSFQWNETKAFPPEGTISPWGVFHTDPAGWDEDNEVCPYGYKTPRIEEYQSGVTSIYWSFTDVGVNALAGYYADGFFDRRMITGSSTVGSGANKAFSGMLFYTTPHTSEADHSIFFPATGRRESAGTLSSPETGYYWTAAKGNGSTYQTFLATKVGDPGFYDPYTSGRSYGLYVRCIREY